MKALVIPSTGRFKFVFFDFRPLLGDYLGKEGDYVGKDERIIQNSQRRR